jgi:hypothetical protein
MPEPKDRLRPSQRGKQGQVLPWIPPNIYNPLNKLAAATVA